MRFEDYDELAAWMEANGCKYHHRACRRGYTRVADVGCVAQAYKGRFGTGWIVPAGMHERDGKSSTTYEDIEYWVKK